MRTTPHAVFSLTLLLTLLNLPAQLCFSADAAPYDPLKIDAAFTPENLELSVNDTERKREIPLRVFLPADKKPAAVVFFSHGLGGSRDGNAFMGKHWAARGYVAVFLQHPGSDTGVWKDKPALQRLAAMKEAASFENFLLRVKDVPAVLDQLERWNKSTDHALANRLDLARMGMSGHSFGAVTTQAVSGQSYPGGINLTDARIKAAIAYSPSSPAKGTPQDAFGAVKIPWMLMTGTKDTSIIGGATAESRQAVYPALPAGSKYELLLHNAEHSAFTDRALPGDKEPRNPNHHRAILALSTAFWDAYLLNDPNAQTWLNSDAPSALLEKADRWQKK